MTTQIHMTGCAMRRRSCLVLLPALLGGALVPAESPAPTPASFVHSVSAAPARAAAAAPRAPRTPAKVRTWKIRYRAWSGRVRFAYVVLPASYGPGRPTPRLPLVVSPHGRGGTGRSNATFWGNLPAVGGFAVINPDGMGRRLDDLSFAYGGQVDDLARMPEFAVRALPWLRIDTRRIYVLGSSMGGQETLMLVARHPGLLAGAAAMDSVADLVRRYSQMRTVACNTACVRRFGQPYGVVLQKNLVREVGSEPAGNPRAWAARSPLANAHRLASSRVPLQIWWSRKDRIVRNQASQSGRLYARLRGMHPRAPICQYVGRWAHSHEMRASSLLAFALVGFGLLPDQHKRFPGAVQCMPAAGV
jgi:pimeloyl-ACP methyl ester carboxylesterase